MPNVDDTNVTLAASQDCFLPALRFFPVVEVLVPGSPVPSHATLPRLCYNLNDSSITFQSLHDGAWWGPTGGRTKAGSKQ